MLRRIFFPVVCFVLMCTMISCEEKTASTPILEISRSLYRTSAAGVLDTISVLDTLQVGDTVRMGVMLCGYYNYLTAFNVQADPACVEVSLEWDPANDQFITSASDPENGKLEFVAEKVYLCTTTLRYIPLAAGKHRVNMVVSSDAGDPYSPRTFYFDAVVK